MKNPWGAESQNFFDLTPDKVIAAVDRGQFKTTDWCLPYHCYENRVYEIGLELDHEPENPSDKFVIAKFYRPGRWNKEQIQEEHDFLWELKENEINAVAPLKFEDGSTIQKVPDSEILYCLFPKVGGRNPYDLIDDELEILGRMLGRIHQIGKSRLYEHRLRLDVDTYGKSHIEFLSGCNFLPETPLQRYLETTKKLLEVIRPLYEKATFQRVHGDCHIGNVLQRPEGFYFVDFDDSLMAPPVQDFWLMFPGRDEETKKRLYLFLDSYSEYCDFDYSSLHLIECLRSLRMIHYNGWIAKRYDDPVFQQTFQDFKEDEFWHTAERDLQMQGDVLTS